MEETFVKELVKKKYPFPIAQHLLNIEIYGP